MQKISYFSKMLHLVCGYAGTGKDTFYKVLQSGGQWRSSQEIEAYSPHHYNFSIFGDSKGPSPFVHPILERRAFADALKQESFAALNLPGTLDQYEHQKNTYMVTVEGAQKTLRQYWIDYGGWRRGQDINYWAKQIVDPLLESPHRDVVVTDFRFLSEYKYCVAKNVPVTTYRVFRSQVPIAPPSVESEHQLDNFLTDYLLLNHVDDFENALKNFPQYSHFRLQGFLSP